METLIEIVMGAANKPEMLWTPVEEFAYFLFITLIVAACLGVAALIIGIYNFFKNRK